VKLVEVTCGTPLLANRYVPLATVVIRPGSRHSLLLQLFLDLASMPVAIALVC
jgi:hypothetical protein